MSRDHRGRHSSFFCPYTPDTGSEREGGEVCVLCEREREGEGGRGREREGEGGRGRERGGGVCVRERERERGREREGEGGKGWYNVIQGVVCAENGMQTLCEYL